ncbi:MAG: tyrosine-type recombinase/integrase [Labilithrix sp.]
MSHANQTDLTNDTDRSTSAASAPPTIPVLVCRCPGKTEQFFGKYRDDEEPDPKRRWKRIPGGAFPKHFETREKALECARRWYESEMACRKVAKTADACTAPATWPQLCDGFLESVKARVRGADSTRDELEAGARSLRKAPVLSSRGLAMHADDNVALTWLRGMLSEPSARTKKPRDPLTVRNAAKVLTEIYRYARSIGLLPHDKRLPTESDEFKAELSGALTEKQKLGELVRVACPVETARALANSAAVAPLRRVMTATSVFTGLRPGELHAFRVRDYRTEYGVLFLDVREQWTLPRPGYPSRLTPPKTVHGRRKVPVHSALKVRLDAWLASGWKEHVGRDPTPDDFLFPDRDGKAFREQRCDELLADVTAAGCETVVKGVRLELYSFRHTFATAARRAGLDSDARDRLLGHAPKDTKTRHYEDEDLPFLAAEIAKLPALLDGPDPAPVTPLDEAAVQGTAALVTTMVAGNLHASAHPPNCGVIPGRCTEARIGFECTHVSACRCTKRISGGVDAVRDDAHGTEPYGGARAAPARPLSRPTRGVRRRARGGRQGVARRGRGRR